MKPKILVLVGGDGVDFEKEIVYSEEADLGICLTHDGEHGLVLVSVTAYYCEKCDDFHARVTFNDADSVGMGIDEEGHPIVLLNVDPD
jgi:hypothetical protein